MTAASNSEARKRASEAASVEISGVGAPNSPNEGPSRSGSENGAQGNSQDSAPTHVVLSRENGAQHPVDSGAIGRLNEAERAALRLQVRQALVTAWRDNYSVATVVAGITERLEDYLADLVREHTDRALAEVEQRIEAAAVAADIDYIEVHGAHVRRHPFAAEHYRETAAIVRAARQEQGR